MPQTIFDTCIREREAMSGLISLAVRNGATVDDVRFMLLNPRQHNDRVLYPDGTLEGASVFLARAEGIPDGAIITGHDFFLTPQHQTNNGLRVFGNALIGTVRCMLAARDQYQYLIYDNNLVENRATFHSRLAGIANDAFITGDGTIVSSPLEPSQTPPEAVQPSEENRQIPDNDQSVWLIVQPLDISTKEGKEEARMIFRGDASIRVIRCIANGQEILRRHVFKKKRRPFNFNLSAGAFDEGIPAHHGPNLSEEEIRFIRLRLTRLAPDIAQRLLEIFWASFDAEHSYAEWPAVKERLKSAGLLRADHNRWHAHFRACRTLWPRREFLRLYFSTEWQNPESLAARQRTAETTSQTERAYDRIYMEDPTTSLPTPNQWVNYTVPNNLADESPYSLRGREGQEEGAGQANAEH